MSTPLGDATVFPIAPDGNVPVRLARGWRTNVMPTESGHEVRAALRTVAVRRLEYTALFLDVEEAGRFRALWYGATERLRFLVPLWSEPSAVTGFTTVGGADAIVADTTGRSFVVGGLALLFVSETEWEVVTIDAVGAALITAADPLTGSYAGRVTFVVPLMPAWLEPPSAEQLTDIAARVPLVFHEELAAIGGIDATVGAGATAVVASLTVFISDIGSPWTGKKFVTFEALALDAAGIRIPGAPIVWALTPIAPATLSAPTRVAYPEAGQQLRIAYEGTTATAFNGTASTGGHTASFSV